MDCQRHRHEEAEPVLTCKRSGYSRPTLDGSCSVVLIVNSVHPAIDAEIISDAGDVLKGSQICLNIDGEPLLCVFPLGFTVVDVQVG